ADVRRKWSHIRNSYSRHLRNEIHGVRTGRGRMVSRWYLADELEYLREHMATDTSFAPHFLNTYEPEGDPVPEPVEAAVEVRTEEGGEEEPDDTLSYFQFFRSIYKDYQELSPRRQRCFRRQCLVFLHRLVDAEGEEGGPAAAAVNLSSRRNSSDSDRDGAGPNSV
ncbi:hypothetical protein OBRU01_12477, partial [Operophtera brumata]